MMGSHKSTGLLRIDYETFQQHLPPKPGLIAILVAIRDAWCLEPRMRDGMIVVDAEILEKSGDIRCRAFRYYMPELSLDPGDGMASWIASCCGEDVIHITDFGRSRKDLEYIQVGSKIGTPLRGVVVPPCHGIDTSSVTWWGRKEDADRLASAVGRLYADIDEIKALLEQS
jgi:hypothetical protein